MDIIIVRPNKVCIRKYIAGLPTEEELQIREELRIQSCPTSFGLSDIRKGSEEKAACKKIKNIADDFPQLKDLFQKLEKLDDDEDVVLVDADEYTAYEVYCWQEALINKQNNLNPVEVYHYYLYDLPAKMWPGYEILTYGNMGYDQFFGKRNKSERVCRFCGGSDAPGSKKSIFGYPKNSHAISYFLGNDSLFCLEECKDCNVRFGHTLEIDLSNYYAFYRAAEGRKSREGNSLSAKGFNFEYKNGCISVYADKPIDGAPKVGEKFPKDGLLLNLDNEEPCNLHNIYKLLVKYVIACLPNEYLPAFSRTVRWINGELKPQRFRLPPVYRLETLENIPTPTLNVYLRKNKKRDVPYCVGELRFMENLFVFAVPYCNAYDVFVGALHKPLAKFVAVRYPDMRFTVENFCDDAPRLITTHVKLDCAGNEVMRPMNPSRKSESEDWWRRRNNKMLKRFGTTDLHPERKNM